MRWSKDADKRTILAPLGYGTRGPVKPKLHTRLNDKVQYTNIVTTDKQTKGYGSNFVLIKHPKRLWGFHILWLSIHGDVRSATMATPVVLNNLKIAEFGEVFLDRFTLILERVTGIPDILGNTPELDQDLTKETGWSAQDTINSLLQVVYGKMWDMEVKVTAFSEIPPDVVEDLRRICEQEFDAEITQPKDSGSVFDGMKPR